MSGRVRVASWPMPRVSTDTLLNEIESTQCISARDMRLIREAAVTMSHANSNHVQQYYVRAQLHGILRACRSVGAHHADDTDDTDDEREERSCETERVVVTSQPRDHLSEAKPQPTDPPNTTSWS